MCELSILIADDNEALIRLDLEEPAIEIAYARRKELQEVRSILETTPQESHSQKLISRAKAILATLEGISEYEALHWVFPQPQILNKRLDHEGT